MKAIELLDGRSSACVNFTYAGKIWTGITVKSRNGGQERTLEASRISGVVGDIEVWTVILSPNDDVSLVEKKGAA